MIVDPSAVVAILLEEPEAPALRAAFDLRPGACMSRASYVELAIVIERRFGITGGRKLERFVRRAGIEFVAVDEEQAAVAVDAFRRYGKGQHRAGLNYGDCFTYALASVADEPVLCVGNDFARTDVELVPLDPA